MPVYQLRHPPTALGNPAFEFAALGAYVVRGSPVQSTGSTTQTLFEVPANTELLWMGFRVTTAWVTDTASVKSIVIDLGDTDDASAYGTILNLGSTRSRGMLPIFEEVTTAVQIEANITPGTIAQTAGALDVWAVYRPLSGEGQQVGVIDT